MRYRIVSIVMAVLCCTNCFSQSAVTRELQRDMSFLLGKNVADYKDRLICKTWPRKEEPYSDTSKCSSYEFILDSLDEFKIDDIVFRTILVHVNTRKEIEGEDFYQSYLSQDRRHVTGDLNTLINYLNTLFNNNGKKKKVPQISGQKTVVFEWKLSNKTIWLSKTTFASRSDSQLIAVLDLNIWKR